MKTILHLGLLFIILISSCTTKNTQKASIIDSDPEYWLTTSLYAGKFYDHPNKILVDFRPFETLNYAQTLDNYTIFPHSPTNIIKAGTKARITKISLPTRTNRSKRPLFSPKNHIWVYINFARERGGVSIFDSKTHILVLPKKIKSMHQVKSYLQPIFSKKDPTNWLLTQENHILKSIWSKRPLRGMNQKHVVSALGPAQKITRSRDDIGRRTENWYYPNYYVVFQNRHVIKTQKLTQK